jgi:hypothetical protein
VIADKEGESFTDVRDVEIINVLVVITATFVVRTTQISRIVVHVVLPEILYSHTRTVMFEGVFAASDCHGAM